jgi:hypothetical protein
MSMRIVSKGLLVLFVLVVTAFSSYAAECLRERVVKIVTQIQRADYQGDRAALERLHADLAPCIDSKDIGVQAQYWRGFALWRRAINGFNDHVDSTELQEDLKHADGEFEEASKKDPAFADAKIGALSCLGLLAYAIHQQDVASPRIPDLIAQVKLLRKEVEAAAPDNPRLAWVIGPMIWNTPPERGGGQAKAIEGYEKGLETIRKHKTTMNDPLEPSWGEPELLMNLAWSNLNRITPDLKTADQDARAALDLVPYWHYVRDILMPQIREAGKKQD